MSDTDNTKIGAPNKKIKDGITRFEFDDGSWIMGPQGPRSIEVPNAGGAYMAYTSDGFDLGEGPSGSYGRLEFEPTARMPLHVHLSARLYYADGTPVENENAGFQIDGNGVSVRKADGNKIPLTGAEIKAKYGDSVSRKAVTEYITIDPAGGPLLLQIGEHQYFVMPGFHCSIAAGTPHTWAGVPAGIKMPDGSVSDGRRAIMHFHYGEKIVGFTSVNGLGRITGSTNDIDVPSTPVPFPQLSNEEICALPCVWENEIKHGALAVANKLESMAHIGKLNETVIKSAKTALGLNRAEFLGQDSSQR